MNRVAHRAGRGFTLIELLVVVALIAMLIAIMVPSLAKARDQSRRAVCLSNLHQQCLGFTAYANDHKQLLPMHGGKGYTIKETDEQVWGKPVPGTYRMLTNYGLLYGKYSGKEGLFFYCPSNIERRYDDPLHGWPTFKNDGPEPYMTWGGYMYAMSVRAAHAPAADGTLKFTYQPSLGVYAQNGGDYQQWQQANKNKTENPGKERVFFGKQQALVYDNPQIIPHVKGHNVAFTDYHAKWVPDPLGFVKAHFPGSPDVTWDYTAYNNRCWVHSFLSRRQ